MYIKYRTNYIRNKILIERKGLKKKKDQKYNKRKNSMEAYIDALIAYAGTIRTASRFTSGHSAGVDSDS
jgi:hypothetical protein